MYVLSGICFPEMAHSERDRLFADTSSYHILTRHQK